MENTRNILDMLMIGTLNLLKSCEDSVGFTRIETQRRALEQHLACISCHIMGYLNDAYIIIHSQLMGLLKVLVL